MALDESVDLDESPESDRGSQVRRFRSIATMIGLVLAFVVIIVVAIAGGTLWTYAARLAAQWTGLSTMQVLLASVAVTVIALGAIVVGTLDSRLIEIRDAREADAHWALEMLNMMHGEGSYGERSDDSSTPERHRRSRRKH